MGCISRIIVLLAIVVQVAAAALGMLVLGSAGILGEAALVSSTDAIVVFALLAGSLLATFVLAMKLWMNSRNRKRLLKELTVCKAQIQSLHASTHVSTVN